MPKYALFVKENVGMDKGKINRLTKKGREFPTRIGAENRKRFVERMSDKKISIRKVMIKRRMK